MKTINAFCLILVFSIAFSASAQVKRVSIKNALNAALETSQKAAKKNKRKANKRPRQSDVLIRSKSIAPEVVDVDPNEISKDKPKSDILKWRDERREVIEETSFSLDAVDGE